MKDERRGMKDEGRRMKDEGRGTTDEGRETKDEGRRMKDEGRQMKDERRRMKDEGRRTKGRGTTEESSIVHHPSSLIPRPSSVIPRSSGFTLVEMILSIAILGVMAGIVGPTLVSTVGHYGIVANRRSTLTEAKVAMDRMMQEMRLIALTTDITTFTSSQIQFNIPSEASISYSLSGGNLLRSGVVLASNVTSLTFTYLDASGNATAVQANIKRIGVEMLVSAGTNYGTLRLRSQVFPRRFSSGYAGYQ